MSNKPSTWNLTSICSPDKFQALCKSISVLESIISPEWEDRYYSYNSKWDEKEEVFEMRNGSGDQLLVLFSDSGIIINGFAHESKMNGWEKVEKIDKPSILNRIFGSKRQKKTELINKTWPEVTESIPVGFKVFINSEPVKRMGTTFCVWCESGKNEWQIGNITYPEDKYLDGSEDLLEIFDGNPATYRNWALEYYDESFEKNELNLALVERIYSFTPLRMELVRQINPMIDDFASLKEEIDEIGYPYE